MQGKTLGYILLFSGLLLIIFSSSFTILVFTNFREPINVFHLKAPTIYLESLFPTLLQDSRTTSFPIQKSDKGIELLPGDAFSKIINMVTTLLLMGFLASSGFKIASLGVLLLRPIEVKSNEQRSS
jgi:hypothetical protein